MSMCACDGEGYVCVQQTQGCPPQVGRDHGFHNQGRLHRGIIAGCILHDERKGCRVPYGSLCPGAERCLCVCVCERKVMYG